MVPERDGRRPSRLRAALAVAPFLALGVADVALLLWWGLDPGWAFLVVPPVAFMCVLAWIGFRTGFVRRRGRPVDHRGEGNAGQEGNREG